MTNPIQGQPSVDPSTVVTPAPIAGSDGKLPVVDPLTVKLEGDAVAEKFRGKTVSDVLASYNEADLARVKAEQESAQWRTWAATKLTDLEERTAAKEREAHPNPMDAFNEDQQKALTDVVGARLQPVIDGLSSLMREVVKSSRPDFAEVDELTTKYFNKMGPEYRVHPEYGWDYAYRMAKAEQMKGQKNVPPPPQPGPTSGTPGPVAPTLTDEEKTIAKRFDLTDEEYVKYMTPVDVTTLPKGK